MFNKKKKAIIWKSLTAEEAKWKPMFAIDPHDETVFANELWNWKQKNKRQINVFKHFTTENQNASSGYYEFIDNKMWLRPNDHYKYNILLLRKNFCLKIKFINKMYFCYYRFHCRRAHGRKSNKTTCQFYQIEI